MEQTLQDLADLVFAALPTTLLVILLWIFLRVVLLKPLASTMDEREAATKGAVAAAQDALKRAEAKAAEYETALRQARGEILRTQDAERQTALAQQAEAVNAAKEESRRQIASARAELAVDVEAARVQLAAGIDDRAADIRRTVLQGSPN